MISLKNFFSCVLSLFSVLEQKSDGGNSYGYLLKLLRSFCLLIVTILLTGCFFFRGNQNIHPDGLYFEGKIDLATGALLKKLKDKLPERIIIVDVVNSNGKVSELGRYISFKIYESLLKFTSAALVPRGVILDTMKAEGIKVKSDYSQEEVKKMSEILKGDVLMLGELVDLGVNIELNMKIIDSKTGEIVSAASEDIEKKESVITLFESF